MRFLSNVLNVNYLFDFFHCLLFAFVIWIIRHASFYSIRCILKGVK